MDSVSMRVDGLRETTRALAQASAALTDLDPITATIAGHGADVGRPLTPRRSGVLAATAGAEHDHTRAVVSWGGPRAPYAGPVLGGWPRRHIRPATTLTRTTTALEQDAPRLLEDGLAEALHRTGLQ